MNSELPQGPSLQRFVGDSLASGVQICDTAAHIVADAPLKLADKGPGSAAWFREQIDWSRDIVTKDLLPDWEYHARAFCGKVKPPRPEGVRVNISYEKVEQKRHQLLFRLPRLKLKPLPRTVRDAESSGRDLKRAVAIFQEVLTRIGGKHGANLKATMNELIFDVLCPSGIAAAKVGYERYDDGEILVETGAQVPDPMFQQPPGSVLGLMAAPMIAEMGRAPNVIAEKYYASRISPPNLIIPPEFRLSDYNQADFLGHRFPLTKAEVKRRKWTLPPNVSETGDDPDTNRIMKLDRKGQRSGQIWFTELFYFAARVNGSDPHPDRIRRVIFADNVTEPIVHANLKDQKFDPRGRLIGGLRTNPIKVLTLRYVSDYPYPPSDCAITRMQEDELSEFRTQTILHRRRSVPMVGIDVNRILDDKIKDRLTKGNREYCDTVPFDGPPANSMAELARGSYPTENRIAADMIMSDVNRLWALGANQSSVTESGSVTATEVAAIAQATANRLGGEREQVIDFVLAIFEAWGQLVQLYADHEDYVEIIGESGAKEIAAWDKELVQGDHLYEAMPDSSLPPDASADRDLILNRHNLIANSPFVNGEQELREVVEVWGGDPDKLVKTQTPPAPEQPKISLAIKGDDLNPLMPQYQNIVNVLIAAGMPADQLSPTAPPAEPQGPADVIDRERLRMAESDERDGRSPAATALVDTAVSA